MLIYRSIRLSVRTVSAWQMPIGVPNNPMLSVDQPRIPDQSVGSLFGHVVLPEVSVSQPKIILEKSADGKQNWDLKKEEKEAELPRIDRLTAGQRNFGFSRPENQTDITAKYFHRPIGRMREKRRSAYRPEGNFTELEFKAQGQGGGVITLTE